MEVDAVVQRSTYIYSASMERGLTLELWPTFPQSVHTSQSLITPTSGTCLSFQLSRQPTTRPVHNLRCVLSVQARWRANNHKEYDDDYPCGPLVVPTIGI